MAAIQKTKLNVSECEFIYRVRLDIKPAKQVSEGQLVELVEVELKSLLDVVSLIFKGEPVEVDAFAFINDETEVYNLY